MKMLLQIRKEQIKPIFYATIAPILFVAINFLLKIRYVSHQSLAGDEPFSVYFSQFDVATIISELSKGNNPPLYEIFLHIWTNIFGISELAVRFPSVVFSSLTVYFIYQICRKFFSTRAAVLAAVLFTLSNYEMYFAHEARVYALFMLLATVSMFQFMKLLISERSKMNIAIYIVTNVLLLYSHFFSWFVLFIQACIVIALYWNKKGELLKFAKYVGLIFIFYLPYAGVLASRFFDSAKGTWVEAVTDLRPLHSFFATLVNNTYLGYMVFSIVLWMFLQQYISKYFKNDILRAGFILLSIACVMISLSISIPLFRFNNDFTSPLIITSFLLFYLLFFIHYQSKAKHTIQGKIVLTWFFIPGFIMFVGSISIPMFIDRYLIYITPAFFIVLGIAISKLDNKIFLSVSLFTAALMAISFSPKSNNDRDVKTMVSNVIEMQKDTNCAIFICPDYHMFTFAYYYNKDYFMDVKSGIPNIDLLQALHSDHIFPVKNHNEVDSIYTANNYDKIIYIDAAADFSYSDNNIKNYLHNKLQSEFVTFDSLHVPGIFNIYSYKIRK